MKCSKLLFLLLFSPLVLPSQDARAQDSRWLLIPGILNEFDLRLNNLEANMLRSNSLTESLQSQTDSMQNSIEAQQRQLDGAWESFTLSEQTARAKSHDLENSLESLGVSYRSSLTRTQILERENADLAIKVAKKDRAIAVLVSIIVMGVAAAVAAAALRRMKWR